MLIFFNYPMIINDKSEYFGEFFLMGEPEGLDKLFDLINCKNSFQLNGESQSIKQILEYRIKLLSGVIDNDKENEQRNAEEIIKLKVLIERI